VLDIESTLATTTRHVKCFFRSHTNPEIFTRVFPKYAE